MMTSPRSYPLVICLMVLAFAHSIQKFDTVVLQAYAVIALRRTDSPLLTLEHELKSEVGTRIQVSEKFSTRSL